MRSAVVAALAGAALVAAPLRADEAAILSALHDYFASADRNTRTSIARRIESDPAFDRARLSAWLHAAGLFEPLGPGAQSIDVPFGDRQSRTVALRIPAKYDAGKPWPLIYALHGTGGDGPSIIAFLEQVLGAEVENYVIAAPTGYGEVVVSDVWPPPAEHPAVLAALRRRVHVDSDRVYVTGYSRGGHASWTLAVLHADLFAGAVPLAGTFLLPEGDRLWDCFLPNLANTHIYCAWGGQDRGTDEGTLSNDGGIAGLNRKLTTHCEKLKLAAVMREHPDKGHGGIVPPLSELRDILSQRRPHSPPSVHHTFRAAFQGQCYWLEALRWSGAQWTNAELKVETQPRETPEQAVARAFRSRLGELSGDVRGQTIAVQRKNIAELIVWFGDDLVDWEKPVLVKVSGEKAFEGKLSPDLDLCLSQAARTYDLDRLRWAGLHFVSGRKCTPLTAGDSIAAPQDSSKPQR